MFSEGPSTPARRCHDCSSHLLPSALPLRFVWATSAAAEKLVPHSSGTRSQVLSRGAPGDGYGWSCLHQRLCLSDLLPPLHSSAKSPETACHQWERNACEGELLTVASWFQCQPSPRPHPQLAAGQEPRQSCGKSWAWPNPWAPDSHLWEQGRWHASKETGKTAQRILWRPDPAPRKQVISKSDEITATTSSTPATSTLGHMPWDPRPWNTSWLSASPWIASQGVCSLRLGTGSPPETALPACYILISDC